MVRVMVEQLGFVTIAPGQPRSRRWCGISSMWSGFTSGIRSGTSASRRWLREFDSTKCPAPAKSRSIPPATDASMAEKTTSGQSADTSAGCTTIPATPSGMGPSCTQRAASA